MLPNRERSWVQWRLAGCLLKPAINIKCCSVLRIHREMISLPQHRDGMGLGLGSRVVGLAVRSVPPRGDAGGSAELQPSG